MKVLKAEQKAIFIVNKSNSNVSFYIFFVKYFFPLLPGRPHVSLAATISLATLHAANFLHLRVEKLSYTNLLI
jgi:hypothetical protein